MWIADTHADTLWAMGVRHQGAEELMVTPDSLRRGGVSLQTLALWTGPKGNAGDVAGIVAAELAALEELRGQGLRQVDDPAEAPEGEISCMLSVEGGEVFEGGIHTVAEYRSRGVRMAAIVWNNENALAHPAANGSSERLTDYGLRAVREMQRLGIAVDVSHLNEAGFYDLFARGDRPPMASHSCCRAMCGHVRNLTDDQLRLMIREGGYVGINFYPYFLAEDGRADAELVAEHIDHVCQMGGAAQVGLGSDFDGIEVQPSDLRGSADLPNLIQALRRRGYDENTIAGIAGGNLLAYFRRIS